MRKYEGALIDVVEKGEKDEADVPGDIGVQGAMETEPGVADGENEQEKDDDESGNAELK